jgi:GAF domain-containing protein/DNA-binding CsgD family transcriptional regulator
MTSRRHNLADYSPDGHDRGLAERRQRALTDLLILVVREIDLDSLMREASRKVAEILAVEFSSVFEFVPEDDLLLLRAGVGWKPEEVGRRTIDIGMRAPTDYLSQAGYTLFAREAVLTEDLRREAHFEVCPLMQAHAVRGSATVKIWAQDAPFGVLGAHSETARAFTDEEKGWLIDVADVLGDAVSRASRLGGKGAADEADDRRAEAFARFEYLRDTMSIIAASTGGKAALEATARVAVRDLADWCFIDLVQDNGRPGLSEGDKITRMVVGSPLTTYRDAELANYFSHEYALDPTAPHGTPKVLREGRPELMPVVEEETLRGSAIDAEHLKNLKDLGPTSYLAVPLRTRGRIAGTLILVSTDPATIFDGTHLTAAEDLASCAALVLSGTHDPRVNPTEGRALQPHLPRPAPGDELQRLAREGEPAIVARGASRASPASAVGLTKRRLEILQLLSEHHTPKTIAEHLVISEKTVRTHIQDINRQLGVSSYREAVRKARSLGIVA